MALLVMGLYCVRRALLRGAYLEVRTHRGTRKLAFHASVDDVSAKEVTLAAVQSLGCAIDATG